MRGPTAFPAQAGIGHLHLLRRGAVTLQADRLEPRTLSQSCAVLMARSRLHQLIAPPGEAADLVSTGLDFGADDENPLLLSLPPMLVVALADVLVIQFLRLEACELGYASTSALSRAFSQRLGLSPTAWQARQAAVTTAVE